MAQKTQQSPLRAVWQAGSSQTPGQPGALDTALCVLAVSALSAMPSQQAPGPATGSQKGGWPASYIKVHLREQGFWVISARPICVPPPARFLCASPAFWAPSN